MKSNEDTAARLDRLARDLPETISLDDVKNHPWLGRIILAADELSNRVDRRALDWLKSRP